MKKFNTGAILSKIDIRDYEASTEISIKDLPEEYSIPEENLPRVKNQMTVGSCVAHALSSAMEYFNEKDTGVKTSMSTGYIYGNRYNTNKGVGICTRDAISNLRKFGDVQTIDFPYNVEVPYAIEFFENRNKSIDEYALKHRLESYFKVKNVVTMKASIMSYGPVVVSVPWINSYSFDENHVMSFKKKTTSFHCIMIYGWNKNGWLFQNSFGESFGNGGRAVYKYSMKINEAWGLVYKYGEMKENDLIRIKRKNINPFVYRMFNFILNLFLSIKNIWKNNE